MGVIKELIADQTDISPDAPEIDKALKIFDDFINDIGIEYFDSDDLASSDGNLFSESHLRIQLSLVIEGNDGYWRGLNGADSLVLLFAEKSNSDRIATNDDGFKGTNSPVRPLILREAY